MRLIVVFVVVVIGTIIDISIDYPELPRHISLLHDFGQAARGAVIYWAVCEDR